MAKYHFSVSQKKTMDSCPRKWFIEKICKVKQPKSKALIFGSTFHTGIENFIKTGKFGITDTKALRMLRANLTFLNSLRGIYDRMESCHVELEINQSLTKLTDYLGYIDFLFYGDGVNTIQDHKTVGSWTWALNKYQLKNDPQMNVYGHLIKNSFNITGPIFFQHNQFSKKAEGACRIVEVEMDPVIAGGAWLDLIQSAGVAEKYHESFDPKDYMEVKGNHNACTDYGGCPYYQVCHFNKKIDLEKGMIMEPENSFFGRPEGEVTITKQGPVTETSESLLPEDAVDLDDLLGDAPAKPAEKTQTQSQTQTTAPKEPENASEDFLDETPKTGEKPPKNGKKPAKERKTKVKKVSIGTMFVINVLPITQGVKSKTFAEVLAPFAKSIAEKNNVADIRTMEFNAGVKELLYYNTEILEECKKEGMIMVDGYNKMEMDAFSYLELDEMCIALRGY